MALKKETVEQFSKSLKDRGEYGLYKQIVGNGVLASLKEENPEIAVLNTSDEFFALYRRQGNKDYFIIGKILRRAAHTLYRQFLRINKNYGRNERFLNLVQ